MRKGAAAALANTYRKVDAAIARQLERHLVECGGGFQPLIG